MMRLTRVQHELHSQSGYIPLDFIKITMHHITTIVLFSSQVVFFIRV